MFGAVFFTRDLRFAGIARFFKKGSSGDGPVFSTSRSLSLPPCLRFLDFCTSVRLEGGAEAKAPWR